MSGEYQTQSKHQISANRLHKNVRLRIGFRRRTFFVGARQTLSFQFDQAFGKSAELSRTPRAACGQNNWKRRLPQYELSRLPQHKATNRPTFLKDAPSDIRLSRCSSHRDGCRHQADKESVRIGPSRNNTKN